MEHTWLAPIGTVHEFEPTPGERYTATVKEVNPDSVIYDIESAGGPVTLTIFLDNGAFNGYVTTPELDEDKLQTILDLFESFDA